MVKWPTAPPFTELAIARNWTDWVPAEPPARIFMLPVMIPVFLSSCVLTVDTSGVAVATIESPPTVTGTSRSMSSPNSSQILEGMQKSAVALQLAAALVVAQAGFPALPFLTADQRLADAAEIEGLPVFR